MIALLASLAAAQTMAGFAVPGAHGGLGGVAEPGAMGISANPAAAAWWAPEVLVDAGAILASTRIELDGEPQVLTGGASAVPRMSAVVPLGDIGLGASRGAPFGRGGSIDSDSPARFHLVSGAFRVIEGNLEAAWRPSPSWTVGAALRVGSGSLQSTKRVDTASMILDANPVAPVTRGAEFWQGEQRLRGLSAIGAGLAIGVIAGVEDGVRLHLSARSPMSLALKGALQFTPSPELPIELDGDVTANLTMPAELWLAVDAPAGEGMVLVPEVRWVGWRSARDAPVDVADLHADSDNPVAMIALTQLGVTETDFAPMLGDSNSHTGMVDAWVIGATLRRSLKPDVLEVQGGAVWATTAIPDATANAGNLDFGGLNIKAAGLWWPVPQLGFGAAGDVWLGTRRTITSSELSLENASSTGRQLPSGNGVYGTTVARAGLTVVVRPVR